MEIRINTFTLHTSTIVLKKVIARNIHAGINWVVFKAMKLPSMGIKSREKIASNSMFSILRFIYETCILQREITNGIT